ESGGALRSLGGPDRPADEVYRDAPLVDDATGSVIYSSWPASSPASARIAITPLATGRTTVLDLKGTDPIGLVDGTLVYVTNAGVLMGVRIDVAKRRLLGAPVQLVDNASLNLGTGMARAGLAPSGTLFYQSGTGLSRVVVAGAEGKTRVLLDDPRDYAFPRL